MNISEFCIKRPVFATVLSLILIVTGALGLTYLDTRFLPKFSNSSLTISASYPGASAKLVETNVTTALEDSVSGIAGIDSVSSTSYQGYSQVVVNLKDGVNLEDVENKIRQNVDNARSLLPSAVSAPQIIERSGSGGDLLDIGFTDPNMSLAAINDYLKRNVNDNIMQVQGVATVNSIGANDYTMQVRLDPNKMKSRQVTVAEVQQAIQDSNVELPAGTIKGLNFDYPVNSSTKINTAKEFDNIVVKQVSGNQIRIRDIGHAVLAPSTLTEGFVRINGTAGVMLSVEPVDNANPITTAKDVLNYLHSIQSQLPDGMKMHVVYDQSIFMKDSIHEVYESIIFAVICVLLVIYAFLGQIRSVSIPVVTIPICIFATFGCMYFLGFTINIITLLAIVLSIGLVVDDAIVVLENIHRHIENGDSPLKASIKGAKEITFPVIAMTLTLAAVYAPVGLVHGKISAIFKPFALTLAASVIVSGFVALTLSPMMCARLLKPNTANGKLTTFLDKFFEALANSYEKILAKVLHKRYLALIAVLLLVVGGGAFVRGINFTFMPQEDLGLVVGGLNLPSGANIHYISNQAEELSNVLAKSKAVQSVLAFATTNERGFSMILATLKPYANRNESAQQVANTANSEIHNVAGLDASIFPPSFGGSLRHQLEFTITANKSYKQLYEISKKLVDQLNQYPGLRNVKSSLTYDNQQYDITVNRQLASQLNVNIQNINSVIATMLGGLKVSTIDIEGQSYDVYMLGQPSYQKNISQLNSLYVSSNTGKLIPLANLIHVKPILAQTTLTHFDRQRSATIDAQLGHGYELATVIKYLNTQLPKILPADVHYQFQGQAKNSADSQSSMILIFLLALVFIYLVLSAQFESFFDPFIILFAVPFSVIGALVVLKMIGGSINIYTIVGLVTLIGLIAKHGILITQFANDLKNEGYSRFEAIVKASKIRLRPILMTTAAMIFGVIPLLFATGASSESRLQIGAVLASGLFFGTFFSLILVPVIYSFINQFKHFLATKKND